MKILMVSRYIYFKELKEFTKNKTGFGLMVSDIAKSISTEKNVEVITRVITKGFKKDNLKILKHNWVDVFVNINLKSLIKGIKVFFARDKNLSNKLKKLYFYLDTGYFEYILKKNKPDIVHLHGIGESTELYMKSCVKLKIPFLLTLHGLIGVNNNLNLSENEKNMEKKILEYCGKNSFTATVISTGIKEKIKEAYKLDSDNVYVVPNGTEIKETKVKKIYNIREKYNIPLENKIILCVGNISKNKNQLAVVEAYKKLDEKIKEKTTIMFLGEDNSEINLEGLVKENKNLIYCGFVDKEELPLYYEQGNLNIFISLEDGFGLSMIEAMVYGMPTLTFSDLYAVKDVYNKEVMLILNKRTSEELSNGIKQALEISWNKEKIKKYSYNFSLDKMAKKYTVIYIKLLTEGNYQC